ncbi:glycosyltransferase [Bacillus sp. FJAT-22090]|uniref:glycosyltransferase n=1 Tax=Bacillus sp. FJAT-22090 TaxID=1581038 RepID=UPI0006B05536|nr:glycosyltransferase [Bacillus sp. FJAT-22090]
MKIAFVNDGKSYLPEVRAYVDFLNKQNGFSAIEVKKHQKELIKDCDIIWRFMGLDLKKNNNNQFQIHEYVSLSVGNFAKQKDFFKRYLNSKPSGRVFLNEKLLKKMNFNDNIPSLKRDMGISEGFYTIKQKKEYDFVYLGDISQTRNIGSLLNYFKTINKGQSILLIGSVNEEIYKEFHNADNIVFTGKVNYEEVPNLASKAVYGINYVPNIFPFNIQTSTKLLEYCALGMKIITTDYKWVNEFENSRGGKFLKIDEDLKNLTKKRIEEFEFKTPNVDDLKWDSIFNQIGLVNFINLSIKST